jgi:hypothetical protein
MYFMFAVPMLASMYRLMFDPELMALGHQWSSPFFSVAVLVGPAGNGVLAPYRRTYHE